MRASSPSGASSAAPALTRSASTSRDRQLADPEFGRALAHGARRRPALDPRALRLEITESALSREPDAVQRALEQALDEHGVRSHLDDFGTGASSLRLLHGFPGDALKIHRSFVIGMGATRARSRSSRRSSASRTTSASR